MRYVMAGLAVLTCPCHLPVYLALLGGTAVGAVLVENLGWSALILGGVFLGSAWASAVLFKRARSGSPGRQLGGLAGHGGNMAPAYRGAARTLADRAMNRRTPAPSAGARPAWEEDGMTVPTVTVYYSPT